MPKLLLHSVCGALPYFTPHLWKQFKENQPLTSSLLILGVELHNACIAPVYEPSAVPSKSGTQQKPTKKRKKTTIKDKKCGGKKLKGYSFQGRDATEHFCIPEDVDVLLAPSFDLIGTYVEHSRKAKKDDSNDNLVRVVASDKCVALPTSNGYIKADLDVYRDVVQNMNKSTCRKLQFISLYDDAPEHDTNKRKKASVERTLRWCHKTCQQSASDKIECWGAVIGGNDMEQRKACIERILTNMEDSANVPVCGLALVGVHRAENRDMYASIVQECLHTITSYENKRLQTCILVANELEQIIDAGVMGVNLIGTSLPVILSQSARAICYCAGKDVLSLAKMGESVFINLKNDEFIHDSSPLMEGCSCFTCKRHTRSYINHLIKSKELLAEILLFMHNLHQLLEVFFMLQKTVESKDFNAIRSSLNL